MIHPVLFAGAGPGDPELITVKGQKAMMEADLIIYTGSLIPEALLKWAKPGATILSSAAMHLAEIVSKIIAAHREGKRVLRLHTGDPSLYGAVLEQMIELDKQSIPYRVIPGVSAAFAAAAALGIEYTIPEISQTLILTRLSGRTPVPESEALASLAGHRASMAIYLSIDRVDEVERILKAAYGGLASCAVVFRASQPDQKVIVAEIQDLSRRVREENITRQAVILVGKVLDARKKGPMPKSKLYDREFKHGFRNGHHEDR